MVAFVVEGIEDQREIPTRVWVSRIINPDHENNNNNGSNQEEWRPLRKVDITALNNANGKNQVLIEKGRCVAHLDRGIISTNFKQIPRPDRELTSCTWFILEDTKRQGKDVIDPKRKPMLDDDSEKVEQLYNLLRTACQEGQESVENLMATTRLELTDGFFAKVEYNGRYVFKMEKPAPSLLQKTISFQLQRGHTVTGNTTQTLYKVEGEEEEEMLGPVNHVVFVLHGIGQGFFSNTFVKETDKFRLRFQKMQIDHWKKECKDAEEKDEPIPDVPNRVEFLPVLWFDGVHNESSSMKETLKSVTLDEVKAVRNGINDGILDILVYLTPNHCLKVLDRATANIYSLKARFNELFPEYDGEYSLIGHSLGSMICWDLLALKKLSIENGIASCENRQSSTTAANEHGENPWGPSLPRPIDKVLPFEPKFTMFLGSPIGLFLSLRNAHAEFDSIRNRHPSTPDICPFKLPSGAIYNIFLQCDPIAYRIEPLLLGIGTKKDDIPEPVALTCFANSKQPRLVSTVKAIGNSVTSTLTSTLSRIVGARNETTEPQTDGSNDAPDRNTSDEENRSWRFPLSGESTRLDYSLQGYQISEITPYASYLTVYFAHVTYFENEDVIGFVIDATSRKRRTDGGMGDAGAMVPSGNNVQEAIDLTSDTDEEMEDVEIIPLVQLL